MVIVSTFSYLYPISYKFWPNVELPQPTMRILSCFFTYLCKCPDNSGYSPYLKGSKIQFK